MPVPRGRENTKRGAPVGSAPFLWHVLWTPIAHGSI